MLLTTRSIRKSTLAALLILSPAFTFAQPRTLSVHGTPRAIHDRSPRVHDRSPHIRNVTPVARS